MKRNIKKRVNPATENRSELIGGVDALDTGVVALERTILRLLLAIQAVPYQQPRLQSLQPEKKNKATENIKSNRKQG